MTTGDASEPGKPSRLSRRRLLIAGAGLVVVSGKNIAENLVSAALWDAYGAKVRFAFRDFWPADPPHRTSEPQRIFRDWEQVEVVPGRLHPDYLGQIHPDIVAAQRVLIPTLVNDPSSVAAVDAKVLPDASSLPRSASVLLIGGPVTNQASRALHGFRRVDGLMASVAPLPELRWRFEYLALRQGRVRRYVSGSRTGDSTESWGKRVVDTHTGTSYQAQVDDNGFMTTDLLLVTHVPVPTRSSVIDVADLHGQGDIAFGMAMGNPEWVQDLGRLSDRNKSPYFQALFRVGVRHDHSAALTSCSLPELIGFSAIG